MTIRMGAREARNNFSDLIGRVHYGGDTVIIERNGKPMVAMVPMEFYERDLTERAERFRRFETLRESIPQYSIEEVEQDIAEAISAVRAEKQTEEA
jgi:prevent-host-death family protein